MWLLSHVTVWPGGGGGVACFVFVVLSGVYHPIHWATGEWLELPSPLFTLMTSVAGVQIPQRTISQPYKASGFVKSPKRRECVNSGRNTANNSGCDDQATEYQRFSASNVTFSTRTLHFKTDKVCLDAVCVINVIVYDNYLSHCTRWCQENLGWIL